ncbi:hypothetical protein ACFL5R_02250 [Pseudomonadota bacterium]
MNETLAAAISFDAMLKGKKLTRRDINRICEHSADSSQIIQRVKNTYHIEISVIRASNPADTVWYIKIEERWRFYTKRKAQQNEQQRKLAQRKYERNINRVKKVINDYGSEVIENCLTEEP